VCLLPSTLLSAYFSIEPMYVGLDRKYLFLCKGISDTMLKLNVIMLCSNDYFRIMSQKFFSYGTPNGSDLKQTFL
jgi:hypothetical protein